MRPFLINNCLSRFAERSVLDRTRVTQTLVANETWRKICVPGVAKLRFIVKLSLMAVLSAITNLLAFLRFFAFFFLQVSLKIIAKNFLGVSNESEEYEETPRFFFLPHFLSGDPGAAVFDGNFILQAHCFVFVSSRLAACA